MSEVISEKLPEVSPYHFLAAILARRIGITRGFAASEKEPGVESSLLLCDSSPPSHTRGLVSLKLACPWSWTVTHHAPALSVLGSDVQLQLHYETNASVPCVTQWSIATLSDGMLPGSSSARSLSSCLATAKATT